MTAERATNGNGGRRLGRQVRLLHKWLGLAGAVLLLASCVSGLVLLHPRLVGPEKLTVTAYAVHYGERVIPYRGTNLGLERSLDGGKTWSEVPMLMPPGEILQILTDHDNRESIFALGREGLIMSQDQGRIWEDLRPALEEPLRWDEFVGISKTGPTTLAVTTRSGLWTNDLETGRWSGQAWSDLDETSNTLQWIHDLHTGRLWPQGGTAVLTWGTGAVLLVTLSGLYLGLIRRNGKGKNGSQS